jgi:Cytosolic carboxypeptidase N-terminal domain
VNATGRQQWFYFRVSNTRADETYTFNIINMEKGKSLFNKGRFA